MQALRLSSHSAVTARSVSGGISAAAFTRDFPQALQAVVMLWACHALQNSPQFIVQGFEACFLQGPILGTDERPEVYSAATPELSWPFRQELNPAGRPISDQ